MRLADQKVRVHMLITAPHTYHITTYISQHHMHITSPHTYHITTYISHHHIHITSPHTYHITTYISHHHMHITGPHTYHSNESCGFYSHLNASDMQIKMIISGHNEHFLLEVIIISMYTVSGCDVLCNALDTS